MFLFLFNVPFALYKKKSKLLEELNLIYYLLLEYNMVDLFNYTGFLYLGTTTVVPQAPEV